MEEQKQLLRNCQRMASSYIYRPPDKINICDMISFSFLFLFFDKLI
jgi:hypothetical protein